MANNRGTAILAAVLMAASCALALGREPGFAEYRAVQESLSRVHPRMRASWLRERGLDDSPYTTFRKPDSGSGLRCIGRWPWGPSWELCGRDSLLFLGSGSGVRILSISDSVHPRQLGQIVARGLVSQLVIRDTLLFVACGTWGAQVYSVSDPANPTELGSIDAVVGNLCVVDTFCFTLGTDSLRAFNVANPAQPFQTSVLSDHGADIVEAGAHLYVAGGSGVGMNVYDISNPSTPMWVRSRGGAYLTLWARGTLLFCSGEQPSYFAILDISDPLNIQQIGYISGYGGHALYVDDYFAYLSCGYDHEGIFVIDVTNPTSPQMRGSYNPEGTENYDPYVPTPLSYGYLASDYGGLMVIDLHDVNTPTEAWSGYKAHQAVDIRIDHGMAYVADYASGMQIVDVSDPTSPTGVGLFDTVGSRLTYTAVARDSFAYAGITGIPGRRYFRVLDVSDPSTPTLVAQESCPSYPEDMVLRDSFCYVAATSRFYIFNVARPREPVLVGICVLPDESYGLSLQDTLAYVSNWPLEIVSVANPASPRILGSIWKGSMGVCAVDTLLYVAGGDLFIYNVARSSQPLLVESLYIGDFVSDVVVSESLAFLACDDGIRLVDVADPTPPRILGLCPTPYAARRVTFDGRHAYAVCWDAGLVIAETTGLGIEETRPLAARTPTALWLEPTVVVREVQVKGPIAEPATVLVFDACGRTVWRNMQLTMPPRLDVSNLHGGVYFIEVTSAQGAQVLSFIKP